MNALGVVLVGACVAVALAARPSDASDGETWDDDGADWWTDDEASGGAESWFPDDGNATPWFPVLASPVEAPVAMGLLTGRAAQLPPSEQDVIIEIAEQKGIDPAALAALRLTENGRAGREFGVLSVSAPTYREQASVAAQSIKNHEGRYRTATGRDPRGADGRYTSEFLTHFSARYAPVGAANDPTNLNANHARNLIAAYHASALA